MVLYQLLCTTAHYREYVHIQGLVKRTIMQVLDNGGVVRALRFTGTRTLPYRRVIDGHPHTLGDYWTLHFDASPQLMRQVERGLAKDPRVLRQGVIKIGSRLQDIVDYKPKTFKPEVRVGLPSPGGGTIDI
ncbi:hypothetical protein BKA62DRAFT_681117 [Auriculariales sp. MPI-PUGE-AT-0066]|nr:hypothetical protein BKA62DRAFT_681117 [Auriculariales sp. MPI-PUGE-AT-0066]